MITVVGENSARLQGEAQPQVDDRDDGAAQVQHTQHMGRADWGMRVTGRPAADFLHPQDVDAVGLTTQVEGQHLPIGTSGCVFGF